MMTVIASVLVWLVALEHFYIMYLLSTRQKNEKVC